MPIEQIPDALDLCLACKGCSNDCPVNVDIPTYKAEFLYHHHKSPLRNRKRHAYAFGFIDKWARLASLNPELVNLATQTPGLTSVAKLVAGMDQKRAIPEFAPMTLQAWFRQRGGTVNKNEPGVILWPDTFNNHFHTQVGTASVEALESAEFRVIVPERHVCCGRPLYDYGFLDIAERYLRRTLDVLRDEIRKGTPVVGMEPSCLAVFRDELTRMLPHDEDAKRLKQNCFHWAEFFEKHDIDVPKLDGRAVVWGHCHRKATGGVETEVNLLKERMGLNATEAKGGCCGLAGAWGFEDGKHDISMQCGELGFLPAVREADASALIVANGFSCKTQLEQSGLGRKAMHTAEVMRMARGEAVNEGRPEPPMMAKVARQASRWRWQ